MSLSTMVLFIYLEPNESPVLSFRIVFPISYTCLALFPIPDNHLDIVSLR